MTCERMKVEDVEDLTGLNRSTLYKLMETGAADLGAIIPGDQRKTYVFFRQKVMRFVEGGFEYEKYMQKIDMLSNLLTKAILLLPDGVDVIREIARSE